MRLCRLLLAAGLAASAPALHAQVSPVALPDTPAGRLFAMWLDAFNSGDTIKMGDFVDRYMPQMRIRSGFSRVREMSGGVEVVSIAQSQPQHIDVMLREKNA